MILNFIFFKLNFCNTIMQSGDFYSAFKENIYFDFDIEKLKSVLIVQVIGIHVRSILARMSFIIGNIKVMILCLC